MINKAVFDAGFSAAGPIHKLSGLVLEKRVYSSPGVYEQGKKKYALIMLIIIIMVYIY